MKDQRIKIRIDKKRYEKFKEKCSELNVTMSAYIRSCIDILLNLNPEKEFQLKKDLSDKNRFRKVINETSLNNFSRELRRIGINLNQTTKSLNYLCKSPFISQPLIDEIGEIINSNNILRKEITIKIHESNSLLKDIKNYYK